jgi:hypothetical protein
MADEGPDGALATFAGGACIHMSAYQLICSVKHRYLDFLIEKMETALL